MFFTDESRFCVERGDGRARVWRRRGERFAQNCVMERSRYGGGSVMVWGGILKNEKSDLILFDGSVNAVTYIDNAINDGMLPFFNQHPNAILMHDNAPPHTAFATRTHLRNLGIPVLPWPSKSPDINPIEHIWDELERRLQARQNVPNNVAAGPN